MIPEIITPWGTIPTFAVFVAIGVLALLLVLHICLNSKNRIEEEAFIFPKIVICGLAGYFFAALFDAVFKFFKYGVFQFEGITFYGGLIGAAAVFYILLIPEKNRAKTQFGIHEWFDLITLPLIAFHFFGRLGCFMAGCCYGKPTDSFLGVIFPDAPEYGLIHNGIKCYPTQLMEAFGLILLFAVLISVKHKFRFYLIGYSILRFILEFFRGDDRGYIIRSLSPAQFISVCILLACLLYTGRQSVLKKRQKVQ